MSFDHVQLIHRVRLLVGGGGVGVDRQSIRLRYAKIHEVLSFLASTAMIIYAAESLCYEHTT